jgi:hypothetical protein
MGDFDPSKYLTKVGNADYLPIKWRLVWLRDRHPDAQIDTQIIQETGDAAVFKATVSIPGGGSATGYGSETYKDFRDYIEKAESKAVGRALAALGFGTQFASELDEGERIADAPVEQRDGLDPRVAKRLDKVATDLVDAVRRVDRSQNAPVTHQKPPEQPKSTRSGNVIPKTAPMLSDAEAIKQFTADIEAAANKDDLFATGALIAKSDIDDEGLRAAYRKRMAAFTSTS